MFKYHSDMGHCFSKVVVVSKKVKKKNKKNIFVLFFLIGKNRHGIGKKVAIFDWQWVRNSAPREGQKIRSDRIKIGEVCST